MHSARPDWFALLEEKDEEVKVCNIIKFCPVLNSQISWNNL
jgi:hypothetical protein